MARSEWRGNYPARSVVDKGKCSDRFIPVPARNPSLGTPQVRNFGEAPVIATNYYIQSETLQMFGKNYDD
jgi:hypothetical protein